MNLIELCYSPPPEF